MTGDDARARNRFAIINLVRLSGLTLVLIGLAIHYRRIPAPEAAAWLLVAAGLVGFFLMPNFVARNWRTPDE